MRSVMEGNKEKGAEREIRSLAVCDLSNLVKPQDIIITEHLTTLLAIVPKYSQKDWLSSYKTLTAYVVPRSSTKLHEDNEYALYTVTLFSRDADNFRTKARDRGFQIRDFEYNSETQESWKQELEKLMQDQETLRNSLCNGAMQLRGENIVQKNHAYNQGRTQYSITTGVIRKPLRWVSTAGFQLMDALLCCMCIYREHSEIWFATVFLIINCTGTLCEK
ncbi:V-type proton ATPase subunit C-like isoform X3 [Camellia sinensis]|uniref:V-type proton ATPase subunit C-like isoform X3 n=1 Tax=Camellia sinensis TaxID=4442 RepID=UPI00103617AB|nr:V-type proton ATPase subunit C-like isoform X3 [Camellia sinensis]